jgi:hypothetical protein
MSPASVDVEALVREIRRRAAAIRASGDSTSTPLQPDAELAGDTSGPVRLRPELGYSSKPLVGGMITGAKRGTERLVHHVVQDALDQVNVRLVRMERLIEEQERRIDDLEKRIGPKATEPSPPAA